MHAFNPSVQEAEADFCSLLTGRKAMLTECKSSTAGGVEKSLIAFLHCSFGNATQTLQFI